MCLRLVCYIVLGSVLSACASTGDAGSAHHSAGTYDGGMDVFFADVTPREDSAACDGVLPGTDTDEDGLDDMVEDANRNCVLDDGETDPFVADTDGDGLLDGDEDVDRNGIWDPERGELDPRHADTDRDGVLDGADPLARVCTAGLLDVARHRVASGEGVFFIDPRLNTEPVFDGAGLLVIDPDAPRASILVPGGDRALRLGQIVGWVTEAARDLDAEVWLESETAGFVRAMTLSVELPDDLPVSDVVASLVGVYDDSLVGALPTFGSGEYRRYAIRVEAEAPPGAAVEGRIAVSIAAAGDAAGWFQQTGLSAIAPGRESTLRARCERAEVVHVETVDVVIAWTLSDSVDVALQDVISAVGGLLSARAADEQVTRVWLVPGDGHVQETAGFVVAPGAFGRVEQLYDAAFSVDAESEDQRVWLNALAFIETLPDRVDSVEAVELVALLGREDSEFRQGEQDGRDGSASSAPLPVGASRDSRTAWYAERFSTLGVSVSSVAVRSADRSDCGRLLDGADSQRLEPALSGRDMAMATGGVVFELCAPDLELTLETRLVHSSGGSGRVALVSQPVAGAVDIVAGDDEALVTGYDVRTNEGEPEIGLPQWVSTDTLVMGYRFWDASLTD